MDRRLRGTTVKLTPESLAIFPGDCKVQSTTTLRCKYLLWENGESKKGFQVSVTTSRDRLYQSAQVVEIEK
jgi:hypothetical protein